MLIGNESFTQRDDDADFTVADFWSWAYSDLNSNVLRGKLAEYLVTKALYGKPVSARREWDLYDVQYGDLKIEVKTAGVFQSFTDKPSQHIRFDIARKKPDMAPAGVEPARHADVYVFCLHDPRLKQNAQTTDSANPLDLDEWEFRVIPTDVLNEKYGNRKSIALSQLKKWDPVGCKFAQLSDKILKCKK